MRVAKDELALDKAIGQYFVVNAHTREFLGAAEGLCCGRYRTRTDDLFRVKEARYQLRQSPCTSILAYLRDTLSTELALRADFVYSHLARENG